MDAKLTRRETFRLAGAGALLAVANVRSLQAAQPATGGVAMADAFANGKYVLPKLPYAYDALEPMYDAKTLTIHHDKHHAGYVRGLNTTLSALEEAHKLSDYSKITALSRALAFHGSGHLLHCLFWKSMTPKPAAMPEKLDYAMARDFGSTAEGINQFAAATKAVEGSGWGVLAYEPTADRLLILQCEKHQNLTVWGVVPLLVCDVWEHAYYLKYQNDRGAWVDNFMKLADWSFASDRYIAARNAE